MNPLTNVKNINKLNELEAEFGVSSTASWHQQYKDSAYIFIGGLPFELTEGDIICVFSQYGEIVNVNLVRDKKSGKSKGYCFIAYEDQRSTILAVDNLNGIKLKGRTLRVDHVSNYRKPKDDDDIDEATKKLRQEGCAPKTPSPSPSEEEDDDEYVVAVKAPKKRGKDEEMRKKKNMKKEKKKHKEMVKTKRESSPESNDKQRSATPPVKIKKEKMDPGYDRAEGRVDRSITDRGDASDGYSMYERSKSEANGSERFDMKRDGASSDCRAERYGNKDDRRTLGHQRSERRDTGDGSRDRHRDYHERYRDWDGDRERGRARDGDRREDRSNYRYGERDRSGDADRRKDDSSDKYKDRYRYK